jgi:hypothetical protein
MGSYYFLSRIVMFYNDFGMGESRWVVGLRPAMTEEIPIHVLLSSSAQAEDPVRRGFSVQSLPSLEYWVTRLRG